MDHLSCFAPGWMALAASQGFAASDDWFVPVDAAEDGSRQGATRVIREGVGALSGARSHEEAKERLLGVAHDLVRSCFEMYNRSSTGLAPEIVSFDPASASGIDFEPHFDARHSLLRPETAESLFILWRVTKNPVYREWGWQIF